MDKNKTIGVDIDGILCTETPYSYRLMAQPKRNTINIINELYDAGHTIIIFTARGWNEYDLTEMQLKGFYVKFHRLICGKPMFDVFIDDRAVSTTKELLLKLEEEDNDTTD